ncbi:MAG: hypothetical protein JXB04_05975, partial [Kiritimatiellae bacterium]|nr:hypothetical protein [Kiritimatiellia bacterium]
MAPTRRLHAIAAVVSLAVAGRSETVQSRFDPSDFQPLETIAAGDNVAFNTTSGQVSLNGGSALNGAFSNVSGRAIAVFCFSNVTLSAAATISGTNAIAILSRDGLAINTTLSISGGDASAVGPGAGVCGGFRGGQGGKYSGAPAYPASAAVNGPGYGRDPTDNWAAGGGAGYGADGGKGAPTWAGGPGGTNYGNTAVDVLWGGSGGAGGSGNNHVSHGGAGGGAIELSAIGDIEFGSSARVYADGGRGNDDYYNGGGGSGGSILLVSEGTISLETGAELSARGGHGGNATSLGRGGGGGAGGRIALFALDFISNGTVSVSGGAGGTSVGEANGNPGASGTVAFEEFYPELPRVQNIGVVEVAADSAGLVGHVTSTGMATTMVFLYWGTSDYTTNKTLWSGSTNLGLRAEGETVTNRVLGLWTNTLYYFRFYATNSYGGTWGQPSASFRTQGGPQVDNATGATVVGMTSARLNGRLTNGSSAEIRIYWGTNDGLEVKGNWCTNEFLGTRAEGSFSAAVGGLTTGRVYYYRCYASNGFGGGWADSSAVFTTLTTSIVSHDR